MINKLKSNKQFSNLVVYGIGQGFSLITPFLVVPYILVLCGEDGYGKTVTGMAISFFLIVVIDYGIDIIGVKEVSVNRNNKEKLEQIVSTAYSARFLLLCLVLIVAAILFITVPYFYQEKELYFLCLPILIGQFINPTWVYQGIEDYNWIAFLNIFSKLIYVGGVFIFIKVSGDYIYANLWWGIGTITANCIAFVYLRTKYTISPKNTSKHEIKEYLKANFSLFFSQLFVSAQLYLPVMLLSFIAGPTIAGKYGIIDKIIGIFKTYITLFFSYVYPRVCYLIEENIKVGMHFWKRYNGANYIAIALGMVLIFYLAEPIVKYFGVDDVTEISGYLRVSLLLPLVLAISIPLKQLVLGFGFQKFYVKLTMALVIFNIIIMIPLLHFFGIYGVLASLIMIELVTAVFYGLKIKNTAI